MAISYHDGAFGDLFLEWFAGMLVAFSSLEVADITNSVESRELGGFECRDIEPLPMASLITPAPLGNETATLTVGFVGARRLGLKPCS